MLLLINSKAQFVQNKLQGHKFVGWHGPLGCDGYDTPGVKHFSHIISC